MSDIYADERKKNFDRASGKVRDFFTLPDKSTPSVSGITGEEIVPKQNENYDMRGGGLVKPGSPAKLAKPVVSPVVKPPVSKDTGGIKKTVAIAKSPASKPAPYDIGVHGILPAGEKGPQPDISGRTFTNDNLRSMGKPAEGLDFTGMRGSNPDAVKEFTASRDADVSKTLATYDDINRTQSKNSIDEFFSRLLAGQYGGGAKAQNMTKGGLDWGTMINNDMATRQNQSVEQAKLGMEGARIGMEGRRVASEEDLNKAHAGLDTAQAKAADVKPETLARNEHAKVASDVYKASIANGVSPEEALRHANTLADQYFPDLPEVKARQAKGKNSNLDLPKEIHTSSQAVKWLMENKKMTKDQAITALREAHAA